MYKANKENILMMLMFIINEELKNFHNNEIDNRYSKVGEGFVIGDDLKKNKIAERIVYWNSFTKKSFDYILNTPSKEVLKTRLKLFKKKPDCTDVMYEQIVEALRQYLEVCNLGSSEAFIELVNATPSKNDYTFKWIKENSQLEALFNILKAEGLIEKDYSLESFKNTLNGGILADVNPIKFNCSYSLIVYLFDQLDTYGFIATHLKNNKVIQKITGVKGVAQVKNNYSDNGPKNGKQIIDIINSL